LSRIAATPANAECDLIFSRDPTPDDRALTSR
jgi:hypothetical protein